jgi:phytoene synthase
MGFHAECAAIVRARDRDRYLADLFVPEAARGHLFALHAFNAEVAAIAGRVSEPTLGEIRLSWWREALAGGGSGHPVATALSETIAKFRLPQPAFDNLLTARVFDLYDDPMPTLNDLEGYAGDTSSALMQMAAIVLAGGADPDTAELAGRAGVAYALTGLLRALPFHAARRKSFLPADLVAAHGVDLDDVFAGRTTPALASLLAELRAVVRRHLAAAQTGLEHLDAALIPAFLPLALVEPHLRKMEKPGFDPLKSSAEIAPWRKQWALWRGARRGLRDPTHNRSSPRKRGPSS